MDNIKTCIRDINDVEDKEQKREYWSTHIKQWQESNLSQQAYCVQAGIKYGTFVHWRGILQGKTRKQRKSFVPVKLISLEEKIKPLNSAIQIKLPNGRVVTIPMTLDIKDIAILIKCLGEDHA
jgi:hypothetical protein